MSVLSEALQGVADLFVLEIKASMATYGLNDSALQQSVEGAPEGTDTIVISMNLYGQWVISGRKPGTKKVPIAALIAWIKRKGFRGRNKLGRFISDTSLAFAIQNAIYKNGIKGRDFLTEPIIENFDLANEMLIEALYRELTKELQLVYG
jgi:hypothetical protein